MYEEYRRKYYLLNKDKILDKCKKYYTANIETIKRYNKDYYEYHKKQILSHAKKYRKIHKIEHEEYHRNHKEERNEYRKHRKETDVNFKIQEYLRSRLWNVLKGNPKLETTMKLVGCNIIKLKKHLKNKFTKGMTWNNYGKWHIDHIRPCASFDLSKESEQKKCFHYKNLQPLWAKDNLIKGDKYER